MSADFATLTRAEQQAELAALRLASAEARLKQASGDAAGATRVYAQALDRARVSGTQYAGVGQQLLNVNRQGASAADAFGGALKSGFLSIIGPAALATAAISGVIAVGRSFGDAFSFNAQLDADRASIELLVSATRNQNQVMQEADRFAKRYAFTQREITTALSESVFVLRASKQPTETVLANLGRLARLNPAEGIQGAAFALGELVSGDVVSLVDRFRISKEEAYAMRDAIKAGADPIVVLGNYLDSAGISMDLLKQRTEGAVGAINDAAVASEELKRVQGELANSAGAVLLVQANAELTRWLRDSLESIRPLIGATKEVAAVTTQSALTMDDERRAVQGVTDARTELNARLGDTRREAILGAQASQEAAIASGTDAAAKELQATKTQLLQVQTQAAASAFLAANPHITESGIRARVTAGAITPLTGRLAELTLQIRGAKAELAGFTAGRPETGGDALARSLNAPKKNAAFADNQAQRALEAQRAQILATGTQAQKIAELNRAYAEQVRLFGPKSAEAISAQTALISARNSTAKAHTSELGTQANLEERIADSKEKQLRSAIDARLALFDDAKQDILDTDRLRRNANTIANAKDPKLRALAQLDSERIPLEDAKRALDIREQSATAGGALLNGRIQQGTRGGALPDLAGLPGLPAGGVGALPGLPGSAGGMVHHHHIYLEGQPLVARVVTELRGGLDAALSGGAGSG